jgi:hypothetical protein
MKVPKDWLDRMVANLKDREERGYERSTSGQLQIPDLVINNADASHPFWECISDTDFPDEWFIKIKGCYTTAVGKESYYPYLSKKGFEEHKDKLKAAYPAEKWAVFEADCNDFWDKVEKAKIKRIKTIRAQLKELEG